jgi:hypothetical protein
LFNAIVGILDSTDFNLAARRKFNQQQILCECINAEVFAQYPDNYPPQQEAVIIVRVDAMWSDLSLLAEYLEANAPYKSKDKYKSILGILSNHTVLDNLDYDMDRAINMAVAKITSSANPRGGRKIPSNAQNLSTARRGKQAPDKSFRSRGGDIASDTSIHYSRASKASLPVNPFDMEAVAFSTPAQAMKPGKGRKAKDSSSSAQKKQKAQKLAQVPASATTSVALAGGIDGLGTETGAGSICFEDSDSETGGFYDDSDSSNSGSGNAGSDSESDDNSHKRKHDKYSMNISTQGKSKPSRQQQRNHQRALELRAASAVFGEEEEEEEEEELEYEHEGGEQPQEEEEDGDGDLGADGHEKFGEKDPGTMAMGRAGAGATGSRAGDPCSGRTGGKQYSGSILTGGRRSWSGRREGPGTRVERGASRTFRAGGTLRAHGDVLLEGQPWELLESIPPPPAAPLSCSSRSSGGSFFPQVTPFGCATGVSSTGTSTGAGTGSNESVIGQPTPCQPSRANSTAFASPPPPLLLNAFMLPAHLSFTGTGTDAVFHTSASAAISTAPRLDESHDLSYVLVPFPVHYHQCVKVTVCPFPVLPDSEEDPLEWPSDYLIGVTGDTVTATTTAAEQPSGEPISHQVPVASPPLLSISLASSINNSTNTAIMGLGGAFHRVKRGHTSNAPTAASASNTAAFTPTPAAAVTSNATAAVAQCVKRAVAFPVAFEPQVRPTAF